MNTSRLDYWGRLDERRRRQAAVGAGRLPSWVFSVAAGIALAAWVARHVGAFGKASLDPFAATNSWTAAVVAGHVVVFFGAPFRMYWRRDSGLLGRLSVPGSSLFRLALLRSFRATLLVALPCVMALVPFGLWGNWEVAARHAALLAVAIAWAGLVAPCLALLAGAIIASEKTAKLLGSIGGEFQAPKTTWLGLLPGLGATGLALALIGAGDWPLGAATTYVGGPLNLFIPAAVVPLALLFWAWKRADAVMLSALLEVSALDRERLAHVDLTQASPLERAVSRAALSEPAQRVFDKDARLSRRRFPIPYFLGLVGVIALWIVAAVNPASSLTWAGIIAGCSGAYAVVMARRRIAPPIEHPRFLRTLAITEADITRAKRFATSLWIAMYLVIGCIPVVARSTEPAVAAIILGAIVTISAAASLVGGASEQP